MQIDIKTSEVLFDIQNKSHLETAAIADAEARWRVEAGTEKMEEIRRELSASAASLPIVIGRFCRTRYLREADNELETPDVITYIMDITARRQGGKAQSIADIIHSYLVNDTLSRYYLSVAAPELASVREKLATADVQRLEILIMSKNPPFMQ